MRRDGWQNNPNFVIIITISQPKMNSQEMRCKCFAFPTHVAAHQVLQVHHQAAVQAHRQAVQAHHRAQVHRQAVLAQAGILTSILMIIKKNHIYSFS